MNKMKNDGAVKWPELIPGILIKRYKRFLADVRLPSGETVTAHCPNSGSMQACCLPGQPVYLSRHDTPERKLKYTWELIQMPTSLVGVNTQVPNKLVKAAIEHGDIKQLAGYDSVTAEVKTGPHSRLDLLLQKNDGEKCYIEVKNCTLVENGHACFPDAVTTRGAKHLSELARLRKDGNRCAMFFLIQRMDAKTFSPVDHIDPDYGRELRRVHRLGVEIFVYDVDITFKRIRIRRELPCLL